APAGAETGHVDCPPDRRPVGELRWARLAAVRRTARAVLRTAAKPPGHFSYIPRRCRGRDRDYPGINPPASWWTSVLLLYWTQSSQVFRTRKSGSREPDRQPSRRALP